MTTELAPIIAPPETGWRLRGTARIDSRKPVPAVLTIRADGSWFAQVANFTFAGQVDLYFDADAGGHFCGPAFVGSSRADSAPFAMCTDLIGSGPLLVVKPDQIPLALPDAEMVDAEVVD